MPPKAKLGESLDGGMPPEIDAPQVEETFPPVIEKASPWLPSLVMPEPMTCLLAANATACPIGRAAPVPAPIKPGPDDEQRASEASIRSVEPEDSVSSQGSINALVVNASSRRSRRHNEGRVTHYGYRYLDPVTDRWPSRDPIREQGGSNLYAFVENDGLSRVDILGLTVAQFPNPASGRQHPDPAIAKASLDLAEEIEKGYGEDKEIPIDIWVGTARAHSRGDFTTKVKAAVDEDYEKIFALIGAHENVGGPWGPAKAGDVIGLDRWKNHCITFSTHVPTSRSGDGDQADGSEKDVHKHRGMLLQCPFSFEVGRHVRVHPPYEFLPRDMNLDENQKCYKVEAEGGSPRRGKDILEVNLDELRNNSCPKIAVLTFDGRHYGAASD